MAPKKRKRRMKRNPVAKALKTLRPKVVKSKKAYTRKPKHKLPPGEAETEG
jgi:hypothetical protein